MIVGIVVSLFKMTDSDFPFINIKVVYRLVISSDIQKELKILSHCQKNQPLALSLVWSHLLAKCRKGGLGGSLRNVQQAASSATVKLLFLAANTGS